jgi:hypothetical protein
MDLKATIPEDIQWTSKPLFQRIYNGPQSHYSRGYTMDLIATIPEDIQRTTKPLFQRIYNGPQSHYSRGYAMDLTATIPEDIQWTSKPLFQKIYNGPQNHYSRGYKRDLIGIILLVPGIKKQTQSSTYYCKRMFKLLPHTPQLRYTCQAISAV